MGKGSGVDIVLFGLLLCHVVGSSTVFRPKLGRLRNLSFDFRPFGGFGETKFIQKVQLKSVLSTTFNFLVRYLLATFRVMLFSEEPVLCMDCLTKS